MAEVVLKNVVKRYEGNEEDTVKNISLEIRDKEFMILVGPSGCGKSTTLRMIAGLEEITSGEIYIGEKLVNDLPPKDRDIAMVFQNYALYPHMTVYDNMAFGLKLRGVPRDEIERRVKEAAATLGLEHLLDRKPKALSGGQRQRVALGRAIVRHPSVFLMDEPLSNLDAKLRVQMRAELNKLHKRLQTTVIYVTHDQTEAMTMGDRICVLNNGIVQQCDTPQNIYDNPANKFVAGFIGSPSMNFLDCVLRQGVLKTDNFELRLPKKLLKQFNLSRYEGVKVTLGVRPEHIYDKSTAPFQTRDDIAFDATIEVIEPMGAENYFYLRINEESTFVARLKPSVEGSYGAPFRGYIDVSRIHLFDMEGKAIL